MKKEYYIAGGIAIGLAVAAGAAATFLVLKKKAEQAALEAMRAEEEIFLDLDGDGEVDVKLVVTEDGAYDAVSTEPAEEEAPAGEETPAEPPRSAAEDVQNVYWGSDPALSE